MIGVTHGSQRGGTGSDERVVATGCIVQAMPNTTKAVTQPLRHTNAPCPQQFGNAPTTINKLTGGGVGGGAGGCDFVDVGDITSLYLEPGVLRQPHAERAYNWCVP